MNTAILIIFFLYMYCRFSGDSVSELNVLDIFLITSIIGGFVYGILLFSFEPTSAGYYCCMQ